MSLKVQCDRCSKLALENDEDVVSDWVRFSDERNNATLNHERIDLCDVCAKEFERFMESAIRQA